MANDFSFALNYLDKMRQRLKNDAYRARYRQNGTWIEKELQSVTVAENGEVHATFTISPTAQTVTDIELIDRSGGPIVHKSITITGASLSEGMLYAIRMRMFDAVANTAGTGAYDEREV